MEKGNTPAVDTDTATDSANGGEVTDDGGMTAMVDDAASGAGGGPSEIANLGKPSMAEWDNGDGTRTRKTIKPGGETITETLDANGKVTQTTTESPTWSGDTAWETTDADGNLLDQGRDGGDWAESTEADGSSKTRWSDGQSSATRSWDKDGEWQSTDYTGRTGSGTDTRNSDGTASGTWTGNDGSEGTYEWGSDGRPTSKSYSNPETGASVEGSTTDGVYTEEWTNADGGGGKSSHRRSEPDYEGYETWDSAGNTTYKWKGASDS